MIPEYYGALLVLTGVWEEIECSEWNFCVFPGILGSEKNDWIWQHGSDWWRGWRRRWCCYSSSWSKKRYGFWPCCLVTGLVWIKAFDQRRYQLWRLWIVQLTFLVYLNGLWLQRPVTQEFQILLNVEPMRTTFIFQLLDFPLISNHSKIQSHYFI